MKRKLPMWKWLLRVSGLLVLAVVVVAAGLVTYLSVTEYRPEDVETVQIAADADTHPLTLGEVTVLSYNTGYAGLGAASDFFMDGGEQVQPESEAYVRKNMEGIAALLSKTKADVYFLQEVDSDSKRSYNMDQTEYYRTTLNAAGAYALNYSCAYVPYPLPTIGKVHSGVQTLTSLTMTEASRVSLPCPFSWPVSTANLKRCLLVSRVPIDGTDRELVLVNLHLEAYDDGEGKAEQTKMLLSILTAEYEKGNYVIAGGDFNQTFPNALQEYPVKNKELWTPGTLQADSLPQGWQFAYDTQTPTCRLLNMPYDAEDEATQYYVIDGFILSPNVKLSKIETLDEGFAYADHNPVLLTAQLMPMEKE